MLSVSLNKTFPSFLPSWGCADTNSCLWCRFWVSEDNRKEGNGLFNDALNTFYLWLYGLRHMVEDDSDSERGNPLPPHGLLFPISGKGRGQQFACTLCLFLNSRRINRLRCCLAFSSRFSWTLVPSSLSSLASHSLKEVTRHTAGVTHV